MLGSQVKVSNNTVQPVRVHWNVPADWYIATLNDGTHTYNGGQVFGRTDLLAESGLVFAVKLQWTSDENQCNAPLVDDVTHRRWIAPVFNTSSVYPSYQNATFGRGLKNSPFMIVRTLCVTVVSMGMSKLPDKKVFCEGIFCTFLAPNITDSGLESTE